MRDIRKLMNIVEGAGDAQLIQQITQNISTLTANGYDLQMIADALAKSGVNARVLSHTEVAALESDTLREGLEQIGRYVFNGISVLLLSAGMGWGATLMVQPSSALSALAGLFLSAVSFTAIAKPLNDLMHDLTHSIGGQDQRYAGAHAELDRQGAEMDALCRQDPAGCRKVTNGLNKIDNDEDRGIEREGKTEWLHANTSPGSPARKYGELWIKYQ